MTGYQAQSGSAEPKLVKNAPSVECNAFIMTKIYELRGSIILSGSIVLKESPISSPHGY
jgi:hypothetical protein